MTIHIRKITEKEQETLDHWERVDDVVKYRRARMLRLSEMGKVSGEIAEVLGVHVETVRETINAFNEGGIAAITPRPRSGGRPRQYTQEVAEKAKDLVREGPPSEEGRATWTLRGLGQALARHFEHLETVSHEGVRRMLIREGVKWYRAKEWIISPDPDYAVLKAQRDWLLNMARQDEGGAVIWMDESWFRLWPYTYWGWSEKQPHVLQKGFHKVARTSLLAALDDETQESFLRWTDDHPNSTVMVTFLEELMADWANKGKDYVVLFWDKASWHTSKLTEGWIADYNQRALEEDLPLLITCTHPTQSPWLMPLESVFGAIKHRILGKRQFHSIPSLQNMVEKAFHRRVPQAKQRHDRVLSARQAEAKKSMSVS